LPPLFGQPPAQKDKQNAAEGNDTVKYHPPQLHGRTIVITSGNGPYEKLQIDKGDQLKPIFPNPFPKTFRPMVLTESVQVYYNKVHDL
jgi:hypothetical protein